MRKIAAGFAVILLLAAIAGAIYERIGQTRDASRLPRIGQAVNIGGRSLNIYCSGTGSPTVILDSGGRAPGFSNMPLQKLISAETRACWFDRAGLGWSDPSPVPQTSAAIAADLHALLQAAHIDPPFILVGQSFSGFNVRVFTKSYPREVAGIVLLDSVQEDQQQYEPRSTLAPINRQPAIVRSAACHAAPLAGKLGLIRLFLGRPSDPRVPPGFTPTEADLLHRLESQPKAIVASSACDAWEKSAAEARAAGNLGDVPLIVLTAGKALTIGEPDADREILAFHEIWVHQLQPKLAALSTRGKQVIVENSSHDIAGDMPTAALDAIRQMVHSQHSQLFSLPLNPPPPSKFPSVAANHKSTTRPPQLHTETETRYRVWAPQMASFFQIHTSAPATSGARLTSRSLDRLNPSARAHLDFVRASQPGLNPIEPKELAPQMASFSRISFFRPTPATSPNPHAKLELPLHKEPPMKSLALTTLLLASLCAQTPPPPKVNPGTPAPPAPAAPAQPQAAAPAVSPETVVVEIDGKKYTAAEVDKIIQTIPAQYQPQVRANPQALTQIFLMNKMAENAVKDGLDKQSPFKELIEFDRINILMRAYMTIYPQKLPVDQASIEKYYKDHQDQFKQVKVRVIQIMFSPSPDKPGADGKKMLSEAEAKAKIDDLRKQALAGTDFAKLATENSDDKTSAAKGGDFGAINKKSSYPDVIKSAVLALKAGGISDPVKQPTSFYLIKADEVSVQPLEDVSGEVTQGIRQERFTEDMKNLQEKYRVKVENPSYFGTHAGPQLQPVR